MRSLVQWLTLVAAFNAADAVRAQEWPRFHIGAAVGNPRWSVETSDAGVPLPPEPIVGNQPAEPEGGFPGWKFAAGFRPLRVVGVEVQYVDFDEGDTNVAGGWTIGGGGQGGGPYYQQRSFLSARVDASVVTALLFIPVGDPSFDVYGKVGVAHVNESFVTTTITHACLPLGPCQSIATSDVHQSESQPYVGFGARVAVWRSLAVRMEYDAIDRDVGDSFTMVSLGLSWEH